MTDRYQVLRLLADGDVHSGTAIGEVLGVSRAAVWKHLQQLSELGIEVQALAGKGYQLVAPLDLLDEEALRHPSLQTDESLEWSVFSEIDSTNAYLMQQAPVSSDSLQICVAEYQTAGRGRRGRQWQSPFASNIYLSLKRQFRCGLEGLGGLSLAVGVACAEALQPFSQREIGLKWPNDLRIGEQKLGGVLIELSGEAGGPCQVVIGVGVNVRMRSAPTIDQPWISLHQCSPRLPGRNTLVRALVEQIVRMSAQFDREGFSPFRERYLQRDVYLDQRIDISSFQQTISGIHHGVDETGSLLLSTANGLERIQVGDVSLRGGKPHAMA